jgi:heme-degrading monooxygenase HmoA
MKSRWRSLQELDPDREYVALVTDIPPKRIASTRRLFAGARQVRRQLGTTDGVVGFSLLARPVGKQYVTLSLWTDEGALTAFAHAPPHQQLMDGLAADMAPTTFVRWKHPGSAGRPAWNDALRRLDAARR